MDREAAVIAGICAVALGAIALWQAVMVAVWRRVSVDAFATCHCRVAIWRTALEAQRVEMTVLSARHNAFVAGVKRCLEPEVRGSARAMHQVIHDAAVAANQAAEEARTAAPGTDP